MSNNNRPFDNIMTFDQPQSSYHSTSRQTSTYTFQPQNIGMTSREMSVADDGNNNNRLGVDNFSFHNQGSNMVGSFGSAGGTRSASVSRSGKDDGYNTNTTENQAASNTISTMQYSTSSSSKYQPQAQQQQSYQYSSKISSQPPLPPSSSSSYQQPSTSTSTGRQIQNIPSHEILKNQQNYSFDKKSSLKNLGVGGGSNDYTTSSILNQPAASSSSRNYALFNRYAAGTGNTYLHEVGERDSEYYQNTTSTYEPQNSHYKSEFSSFNKSGGVSGGSSNSKFLAGTTTGSGSSTNKAYDSNLLVTGGDKSDYYNQQQSQITSYPSTFNHTYQYQHQLTPPIVGNGAPHTSQKTSSKIAVTNKEDNELNQNNLANGDSELYTQALKKDGVQQFAVKFDSHEKQTKDFTGCCGSKPKAVVFESAEKTPLC